MAITTPPPPPNSGNPAQFNERADGFLGWFPTFVSDFNADLPLLRGRTYATRAGTANAIVLTTGGVALAVGMQVRWRAAATNTGAVTINVDGQGAIEARTITNVALPAGYIRTDADTVATYDGTRWIVGREIERGSNANGDFVRLADGTQLCWRISSAIITTQAAGAIFRSILLGWTFPAAFSAVPWADFKPLGTSVWGGVAGVSGTAVTERMIWSQGSFTSATISFSEAAIGKWY